MGNLYHANDKTTTRIRKEMQNSEETLAQLARRLSLNPKTARYWKQANRVTDKHSGPPTLTVDGAAARRRADHL
jgi:hypothetical protein